MYNTTTAGKIEKKKNVCIDLDSALEHFAAKQNIKQV